MAAIDRPMCGIARDRLCGAIALDMAETGTTARQTTGHRDRSIGRSITGRGTDPGTGLEIARGLRVTGLAMATGQAFSRFAQGLRIIGRGRRRRTGLGLLRAGPVAHGRLLRPGLRNHRLGRRRSLGQHQIVLRAKAGLRRNLGHRIQGGIVLDRGKDKGSRDPAGAVPSSRAESLRCAEESSGPTAMLPDDGRQMVSRGYAQWHGGLINSKYSKFCGSIVCDCPHKIPTLSKNGGSGSYAYCPRDRLSRSWSSASRARAVFLFFNFLAKRNFFFSGEKL
jgi:hypothetical protein